MTLTFGIIGCGEITSKRRADQLGDADGVDIGLAMDIEEWAAEDIGERFDVPATTDEATVLDDPSIDAVYIATPHHLHAEQTIRAAEAGKHVVVEKPIATSAADAREMIDVCEREGVRLSVPLARFRPSAITAKELVDDGVIGSIVGIRIASIARKPGSYWSGGYTGRIETDWRKQAEQAGGGILIMNSIHTIDQLRYATGLTETRVYAEADTFATDVDVEDFACVTIRYENGAIGSIEASSFLKAGGDGGPHDRIYGEDGTIELSSPVRVNTAEPTRLGEADTWHEIEPDPVEINFFERFATAVREGSPVPVPADDARKDLEVILGAYESADRRAPVDLPLP